MSPSEQVYLLPIPLSCPTHQSSLHEGLLLSQEVCPALLNWDSVRGHNHGDGDGGNVLTAVFDTSLAGDMVEGIEYRIL